MECYANRVGQRNRQGVASAAPCRISNSVIGQSNIWNCRFFFVSAETLVSKNRTIDRQKKVIIGFIIGCSIGLFGLGYVFIESLRDSIEQLARGWFCIHCNRRCCWSGGDALCSIQV